MLSHFTAHNDSGRQTGQDSRVTCPSPRALSGGAQISSILGTDGKHLQDTFTLELGLRRRRADREGLQSQNEKSGWPDLGALTALDSSGIWWV